MLQDAKKREADARVALDVAQKVEDDDKAALDAATADAKKKACRERACGRERVSARPQAMQLLLGEPTAVTLVAGLLGRGSR